VVFILSFQLFSFFFKIFILFFLVCHCIHIQILYFIFILKHIFIIIVFTLLTIIDNNIFVKSVSIFFDSILLMTLAVESTGLVSIKPILGVISVLYLVSRYFSFI